MSKKFSKVIGLAMFLMLTGFSSAAMATVTIKELVLEGDAADYAGSTILTFSASAWRIVDGGLTSNDWTDTRIYVDDGNGPVYWGCGNSDDFLLSDGTPVLSTSGPFIVVGSPLPAGDLTFTAQAYSVTTGFFQPPCDSGTDVGPIGPVDGQNNGANGEPDGMPPPTSTAGPRVTVTVNNSPRLDIDADYDVTVDYNSSGILLPFWSSTQLFVDGVAYEACINHADELNCNSGCSLNFPTSPKTAPPLNAAGTYSISAEIDWTSDSCSNLDTNWDTDAAPGELVVLTAVDIEIDATESIDPVVAGFGVPGNLVQTLVVDNLGPGDATNIVIDVNLRDCEDGSRVGVTLDSVVESTGTYDGAGTWTIPSLAAADAPATLAFTCTVASNSPVADSTVGGRIRLRGEMTGLDPSQSDIDPSNNTGNSGRVRTTVDREYDIALSKTESVEEVIAGSGPGNLTYVVTATNNGPSDVTGAQFTEVITIPGVGVTIDSVTESAGVLTGGPTNYDWTVDIPAGGSETITVVITVASNAAVGMGVISDTATWVAGDQGACESDLGGATDCGMETTPGNNTVTEATDIGRQIDLTVTKSDDPDPVVAGLELNGLEYVVTVTNNGPSDGDAVVINDPQAQLPVGVVLESWVESAGTYDGTDWVVDLPAGATETLTMTLTVGPDTVPGKGAIVNVAMVTGSGGGEDIINPDDDTATETTDVLPTTASWTVSKDFLDDSGASITATLTCTSGEVTGPIQVSEGNDGVLTVERFLQGPFGSTTCEVTESIPPDYFQVSASEDCEVEGFAHEDEFGCDFVNAPIKATFNVTKDFSDNNPEAVRVVIECNTGLPLMQEAEVSEFGNPFTVISFIVQSYEVGALNCEVFEDPVPAGYEPDHEADEDPVDAIAASVTDDDVGCYYDGIQTGNFYCDITDTLLPVEVVVNKEWIDENPGFNNPTWVEITFSCNAPIVDDCESGQEGGCGFAGDEDSVEAYIDPNYPGVFSVLPHWDGSTVCSATEEPEAGVIQDQDDCASIPLAPGQGGECTIVNTRFYEGIPTLSQYGLMILSLLMLGVGMIAFRRFS